ncbi:MAG TPA: hypothetical protein VF091_06165 [Gaiellaceae bacterium]
MKLNEAEVVREASVIACPGFEHVLRVFVRFDFGYDSSIPVVYEKQHRTKLLPHRSKANAT